MIPTTTELMYFVEIYQTKHITRAAMRLGVSQPTLTQSLQSLERKIGSLLFHRNKQGVVATSVAVSLYANARTLIESWKTLQEGVTRSQTNLEGTFMIGCHPSVGAYTLGPLIKRVEAFAPQLNLRLVHDFSKNIADRVASFEIDLGFVVNPPKHPDLVLKLIGRDRVTFWKSQSIKRIPKILFADSARPQTDKLIKKCSLQYFSGWKHISTPSLELIRTLTAQGHGVGILPERVARADTNDLAPFDPALPSRPDEIFVAYRKDNLTSKAARELVKLASAPISQSP